MNFSEVNLISKQSWHDLHHGGGSADAHSRRKWSWSWWWWDGSWSAGWQWAGDGGEVGQDEPDEGED